MEMKDKYPELVKGIRSMLGFCNCGCYTLNNNFVIPSKWESKFKKAEEAIKLLKGKKIKDIWPDIIDNHQYPGTHYKLEELTSNMNVLEWIEFPEGGQNELLHKHIIPEYKEGILLLDEIYIEFYDGVLSGKLFIWSSKNHEKEV